VLAAWTRRSTSLAILSVVSTVAATVRKDTGQIIRPIAAPWDTRKKLLRTANILKAALLTYKEVVYDIDLTKIEFQDGVLCLHQNQRSITARSKRGLSPGHLTTNIEHREAALVNNQCTTAMALLGRLTRKLLKGGTAPQDYHLGKLGFTFSRGSLDYRSIGPPHRKAADSNKAHS
jgi:hypothetical protein